MCSRRVWSWQRVVGVNADGGGADLFRHERNHRLRWPITGAKALARVAQESRARTANSEPVHAAPLGPDERQVVGTEHRECCAILGALDGDGEQAIALLGGQQGTVGHGGFVPEGRWRS